jgi:hypothetical protein
VGRSNVSNGWAGGVDLMTCLSLSSTIVFVSWSVVFLILVSTVLSYPCLDCRFCFVVYRVSYLILVLTIVFASWSIVFLILDFDSLIASYRMVVFLILILVLVPCFLSYFLISLDCCVLISLTAWGENLVRTGVDFA